MSSNSAPTYYFSGINFNSSYFTSGSSTSIYLKKTLADTAQGLITFDSGLKSNSLTGKLTTDAIGAYNTTTALITLGSATGSLRLPNTVTTVGTSAISLFDTQNRNVTMFNILTNYQFYLCNTITTGSIWIATNGTNQTGTINIGNDSFTTNATFSTGVVNINCPTVLFQPLVLNSSSLPTSNLQLGNVCYRFTVANKITSTANNTLGTYTAFTSNTLLPIGTYLVTMTGCFLITATASFSGAINALDSGYYQGTSATITTNTKNQIHKLQPSANSFSENGSQGLYEKANFSWSFPVQNTVSSYIAGYASYTLSTVFTSGSSVSQQIAITSFSVTRIG